MSAAPADRGWATARSDQMSAAARDAVGLVTGMAQDGVRLGDDDRLRATIDAFVRHLYVHHLDSGLICRHALPGALLLAPRPVVLDVPRGILACVGSCHTRIIEERGLEVPPPAGCLRCAAAVPDTAQADGLLVAHGPIVVLAWVCPRCRDDLAAPAPNSSARV